MSSDYACAITRLFRPTIQPAQPRIVLYGYDIDIDFQVGWVGSTIKGSGLSSFKTTKTTPTIKASR